RAKELVETARVRLAIALGDDRLREHPADRLVARPAERLLRGPVPGRDPAGAVHRDERLVRRLDDAPGAVGGLLQLRLGLLSRRDVGRDAADAVRLPPLLA